MNIYRNGAKRGRTLRAQLTQNVFPLSTELLAGVLDLVYRPMRPAEVARSAGEVPAT